MLKNELQTSDMDGILIDDHFNLLSIVVNKDRKRYFKISKGGVATTTQALQGPGSLTVVLKTRMVRALVDDLESKGRTDLLKKTASRFVLPTRTDEKYYNTLIRAPIKKLLEITTFWFLSKIKKFSIICKKKLEKRKATTGQIISSPPIVATEGHEGPVNIASTSLNGASGSSVMGGGLLSPAAPSHDLPARQASLEAKSRMRLQAREEEAQDEIEAAQDALLAEARAHMQKNPRCNPPEPSPHQSFPVKDRGQLENESNLPMVEGGNCWFCLNDTSNPADNPGGFVVSFNKCERLHGFCHHVCAQSIMNSRIDKCGICRNVADGLLYGRVAVSTSESQPGVPSDVESLTTVGNEAVSQESPVVPAAAVVMGGVIESDSQPISMPSSPPSNDSHRVRTDVSDHQSTAPPILAAPPRTLEEQNQILQSRLGVMTVKLELADTICDVKCRENVELRSRHDELRSRYAELVSSHNELVLKLSQSEGDNSLKRKLVSVDENVSPQCKRSNGVVSF